MSEIGQISAGGAVEADTGASHRNRLAFTAPGRGGAGSLGRLGGAPPWALGLALALPLAVAYLVASPPSADLAAASYRSELFARAGLTIWDTAWYGGHSLPGYSLLAPALGAWLGVHLLLSASAVLTTAAYGAIAPRFLPRGAALASTLVFAFGCCWGLGSGRVPFTLGAAIALAAVAMLPRSRGRRGAMIPPLGLAVVASAASPVAGAFLALAGVALGLSTRVGHGARNERSPLPPVLLAVAAMAPVLVLGVLFPEAGFEPFAASSFWPQLAAAILVAAILPTGGLTARAGTGLRAGAALYGLALIASFTLRTPMGGNAARLGELIGPPLVAGALWAWARSARGRNRWAVLGILAPLLLYWQLQAPVRDLASAESDPSVHASFYAPLLSELGRIGALEAPRRIEVPPTRDHWEARWLAGHVMLARGWERQLDEQDRLFYRGRLTAPEYVRWLRANAVSYVAVPIAPLDHAGVAEAKLIHSGVPELRQVWRSSRWQLFALTDPTPLVEPPARIAAVGPESFAIAAPAAGSYEVNMRWTPYWTVVSGAGCVAQGHAALTEVEARKPGTIRLKADFSLGRVFSHGRRCNGS